MKRIFVFCLTLCLILCGCVAAPEETEPSTSSTTESSETTLPIVDDSAPDKVDEATDSDSTLTIGNIQFSLPDGFTIYSEVANSYGLISDDKNCVIGLYGFDVSPLTEDSVKKLLPTLHSKFLLEDEIRYDESDLNYKIAGFPVIVDFYADISNMDSPTINMNTTFTDSYYSYTLTFVCNSGSGRISEFSSAFGEMVAYSEYIGDTPRFDYVQ